MLLSGASSFSFTGILCLLIDIVLLY
eukprot:COSAG05_NODE_14609_length_392_cov_0.880546_2_plen_25_part_01